MKGKVCLINANLMRPPIGPIGLDYLADALAAAGYAPEVLDLALAADPEAALRGYFAAGEPLAVGLTIRNTDDCYFPSGDFLLPEVRRLIGLLRELSAAPIVAGGVGFSTNPEAALEYLGLELGIRGDGEHTLPRLLSELAGDRELERVPNLVWRRGERVIRNRAAYPSLKNTAHSRAFVDNITYFRLGGMGGIETKRGCPGRCAYCADPVAKGRRSRPRHPGLVADEVERLLDQGVDHLHLCDSEFNLPLGHAVGVLREWVRRGLSERGLRWYGYLSPVPFSAELADLALRSGCAGLNFGIDHLDDAMLASLGRAFRRADVENTAAVCRSAGLNFMIDLLLGSPGETEATLRAAIEGARGLGASRVGIAPGMRVYPRTRMAARLRAALRSDPAIHRPAHSQVAGQEGGLGLLEPTFYVSPEVSPIVERLQQAIGHDERFFLGLREESEANYNYNDNEVLERAIAGGMRGAYWDILRRLAKG